MMMRRTVLTLVGMGLLGLVGCGGKPGISTCQLSGANAVPAVSTNATGTATATLDGDELTVQGAFSGLQSDLLTVSGSAGHIHQAATGVNGAILFNLSLTSTDQRNGTFTGKKDLSSAEQDAFEKGLLYVNIHTTGNPNGEIRGQFSRVDR